MNKLKRMFHNPVLASEMKVKMRGIRAALAITFYLGILILISFLYFKTAIDNQLRYGGNSNYQSIGIQVYGIIAVIQFILIVLITPAQTAGTISGEREKQTLDLLLCTRMSPLGIIFGKLLSSMGFILLLIISSVPLFSLVFLFGGIGPKDVAMLFVFYLVTAFAIGSIGIFCSTLFKKTVVATVVSYVTIFALAIVSVILGVYLVSAQYNQPVPPASPSMPAVLYVNPAVGLLDLLGQQTGDFGLGIFGFGFSRLAGTSSALSIWVKNSIVLLVIAVILLFVSAVLIKPVKRRGVWFSGRRKV